MQIKHNILKLYLLRGFLWFMVSMPIIVLFFQENGLTLMEVMILQSVYSFTIDITEIPSGYFARLFWEEKFTYFRYNSHILWIFNIFKLFKL